MNLTTNKKLHPFMQVADYDYINGFSLSATGFAGTLVKVATNDVTDATGVVADSVGATYNRIYAPKWGVKAKVVALVSGDSAAQFLGVTTKNVLTVDENGMNLAFYKTKKDELNAVLPDEANIIAARGTFTFGVDAFVVSGAAVTGVSSALIGKLCTVANVGGGKFDVVDRSAALAPSGLYRPDQILGSVIGFNPLDATLEVRFK